MDTTRPGTPRKLDIIYKECVIIGNGPSAISLSYLLSGNWPYYTGDPLANEYVQARLNDSPGQSLVTQDLAYLSDGVEGRSHNPVANLYDLLSHPHADLGLHAPAALRWQHHPEHRVDHVVLGRGRPGGVWQKVDGCVNTLSLGQWMELPNLPFKEWLNAEQEKRHNCDLASPINDRATIEDVRQYYRDYIRKHKLRASFQNEHSVTCVRKVLDAQMEVDCDSGECKTRAGACRGDVVWEVCGKRRPPDQNDDAPEGFCYRTRNVVLATGSHDQPNRLGVPGEGLPHVMHSLQQLQSAIRAGTLNEQSDPVMIVGAGLSVGDAILTAESAGLNIVHVFRRKANDPEVVFKNLSTVQYPDYHRIHQMMTQTIAPDHYVPYERHYVSQFMPDRQVIIHARDDPVRTPKIVQTSAVLVLIGSKPDLSFLAYGGQNLGYAPGKPVDSKLNPMDVNAYTYESSVETGLFAMGALVGDNFVRFLQGGSLAICSRVHETNRKRAP